MLAWLFAKNMKKILFLLIMLVIATMFVSGQEFEKGQPSDLKHLTKVFIPIEPEYAQITAEFKKANVKGLKMVDTAEAADFSIIYANEKSTPTEENYPGRYATGMVVKNSEDGLKLRVLWEYKSKIGERGTARKFARNVIAKYKAANGLK